LIILNPSRLTVLLDRLFSNLVKMIKVGTIIRTKNVIIASPHPLGAPPPSKIDVWPGAQIFRIFWGLAGNGRAPIELEANPGLRQD
jgi:hypothetical protein